MTAPIAWTTPPTSPEETELATVTGSVKISHTIAPAIVAANTPIMATRLTLQRANPMIL